MVGNQYISLRHIKTSTVEQLERTMLKLNLDNGKEIKFHNVQFVKNNWYAFYYANWETSVLQNINKEETDG